MKLLLTGGLVPADNVLASSINKMDLLWGSAGKVPYFDGRQQAVRRCTSCLGNSPQFENRFYFG